MENLAYGREIAILLVGAGGYGRVYLDALSDGARADQYRPFKVAGAVEVAPGARAAAESRGIPVFNNVSEFYDGGARRTDLAVISSPIHFHYEQILACLSYGSNVLCEKPMCVTVEEADAVIAAEKAAGRFVRIGYQMSFSRAVLALKADILSGAFGRPLSLKTIVHYPRGEDYYARNGWAGRKRAADNMLVLDSPIHNAVAHHLNNMLFLLGRAPDRAADIEEVQAELYRGNPDVQNFDTAALRCLTSAGADIHFYTTHCLPGVDSFGPICQYRFERATIMHTDDREHETFTALFDDGSTRRYGPPNADPAQKLWDCVEAARGNYLYASGGARPGDLPPGSSDAAAIFSLPPSGAEAAAAEVLCMNGAQLSHPISDIPAEYATRSGEPGRRRTEVARLARTLLSCFDARLLPSELPPDIRPPWATRGKIINANEISNIDDKICDNA